MNIQAAPQRLSDDEFPFREARDLVRDLFVPNARIYWLDFLFHVTLGWAATLLALNSPITSALGIGAYVVASLAFYRAVIFTHELAHLKKGTFKLFRLVWNLTCGMPLMVPSFTYHGVHNDHHKRDIYGTGKDGEYMPFGAQHPGKIPAYVLLVFVLPVLFATRFMILAPLSWLVPPLKRLAWERFSSLSIDLAYQRPAFSARDPKNWWLQELGAFIYGWSLLALVIAGVIPVKLIVLLYMITLLIFFMNSLRTLAAHAYRNLGDEPLTLAEQYLDSVNVPGHIFFTALWAPVGLRYHATHHLFPAMPYHSIGRAHRRLVAGLADNKLYLAANRKSLLHALRMLWREAAESTNQATGAE